MLVPDYRRYLDPRTLARIARLELRARLVAEGTISGMHRSPYRGSSVEFAEHRQYVPGDDLRYFDWKVFSRTDKPYVRQYEEDSNLVCELVVDCSASMAYRSPGQAMSKHDYGISLAAAIAFLALRQQDAVGLTLFDESIRRQVRASDARGQWRKVIEELQGQAHGRKTSIRGVLESLAERLVRRSLVVVISDLLERPEDTLRGLQRLAYRRHDVLVLHVLDEAEVALPFRGPTLFAGMEGGGRILAEPQAIRDRYLEIVGDYLETLRRGCRALNADYGLFVTSQPLDAALGAYLAARAARWRQGRGARGGGGRGARGAGGGA